MTYAELGSKIGALVDVKNVQYGDSSRHTGEILKVLYPSGISPHQYADVLYIARVIDKLFRIATAHDIDRGYHAQDIARYSLLKCKQHQDTTEQHNHIMSRLTGQSIHPQKEAV